MVDDLAADRETEARPRRLVPIALHLHLMEAIEDVLLLLGGDPWTVVAHGDLDDVLSAMDRLAGSDMNRAFFRCELQRIAAKIRHHLDDAIGIERDRRQAVGRFESQ